jgi:hypothetical protein
MVGKNIVSNKYLDRKPVRYKNCKLENFQLNAHGAVNKRRPQFF